MKQKAIKINPHDVEPIVLSQRVNYKLIDPTTVDSKHLTFGMVNVGTTHDTAEFAVESICRWWKLMGREQYPEAKKPESFLFENDKK